MPALLSKMMESKTQVPTMFDKRNDLIESLLNNITVGVYLVQSNNSVILNSQLAEYLMLDEHELTPHTDISSVFSFDILAGEYFDNMHLILLSRSEEHISWYQYIERLDGSSLWLEISAKHLQFGDQKIILGTVIDVTPYTVLSEAMSSSTQTLHLMLDAMEDPIYAVTDDYQIVYANKVVRDIGRLEAEKSSWPEDFTEWPCYRFRGHEKPCEDCQSSETFSTLDPVRWEFFHEHVKKWYAVTEVLVRLPHIPKKTKLIVARNITPWKNAEKRIRNLSHGLLNAQEAERNRLSRELHDDLGQQLCTMKLLFNLIVDEISEDDPKKKKTISRLNNAMESSVKTVRGLAAGLRPPAFEVKGLEKALEDHFHNVSSTHQLSVDFMSSGLDRFQLDDFTAINLFRIAQEALHNVTKHAEARKVNVQLNASNSGVKLLIEDDGRGFDINDFIESRIDDKHLGLAGMAERVDLLNGEFSIASIPGKGTKINVFTK